MTMIVEWLVGTNTANSVVGGHRSVNPEGPLRSHGRGLPFPGETATGSITVMSDTQPLSQAAYDRLKAELDELSTVGRVDIARKIQSARELGDLKENGDYHAAKEEQGKMEGRIRHLTAMVENAQIIEGGSTDEVQHGSIVTIAYEGDDDTERYLIGSIEERHGDVDVISPGSPMGKALLGAAVGSVVDFEAPGGVLKVRVVELEG